MFSKTKQTIMNCVCTGEHKTAKKICAIVSLVLVAAIIALVPFGFMKTTHVHADGKTISFRTLLNDPYEILDVAGVNIDTADKVLYRSSSNTVTVERAFPVDIVYGNETISIKMTEGTVSDAIQIAGLNVSDKTKVSKELSAPVTKKDNTPIKIDAVEYAYDVKVETVPFQTVTVESADMYVGEETSEGGVDGTKVVIYRQTVINGKVEDSAVDSEVITSVATDKVVTKGTKKKPSIFKSTVSTPVTAKPTSTAVKAVSSSNCVSTLTPSSPIALDANGRPVNYSKVITGKATAYTAAPGKHCSTGVVAAPGYVAVNPKIIPYGTKLYIVSSDGKYTYGYAIAADTGGFIYNSSTVVDLFFSTNSQCVQFGRRNVEIYVIG